MQAPIISRNFSEPRNNAYYDGLAFHCLWCAVGGAGGQGQWGPRNANPDIPVVGAAKKLKKMVKGLGVILDKKAAQFCDDIDGGERVQTGEYILIFQAVSKDGRTGDVKRVNEVVGTHGMKSRLTPDMLLRLLEGGPTAAEAAAAAAADAGEAAAEEGQAAAEDLGDFRKDAKDHNGENLSTLCSKALAKEWEIHVEDATNILDLPSAAGRKQKYKLVKDGKVKPFPWWEEIVPGAEFDASVINTRANSEKLFRFLAPRYVERVGGGGDNEEEEGGDLQPVMQPVVPSGEACVRDPRCSKRGGHRGACKVKGNVAAAFAVPQPGGAADAAGIQEMLVQMQASLARLQAAAVVTVEVPGAAEVEAVVAEVAEVAVEAEVEVPEEVVEEAVAEAAVVAVAEEAVAEAEVAAVAAMAEAAAEVEVPEEVVEEAETAAVAEEVPQPGAVAVEPQPGAAVVAEEPQPGAAAVAVAAVAVVAEAAVVTQPGGGGAGGSPPARLRKGKGDAEKRRKVAMAKAPTRGGEGQAAAVEADGMRTVDGVRREAFMSRLHQTEPLRFMGSGDIFRLKAVIDGAPKIDHPKCKGAGGCKGCGCVGRVRAYVDIVPGKVGAEYKAWYRDGGHKEWAALTREFPDYLDIVMEDVQARKGKKKVGNNKRTASATANDPSKNKRRRHNPKRARKPPANKVILEWMTAR